MRDDKVFFFVLLWVFDGWEVYECYSVYVKVSRKFRELIIEIYQK